MPKVRLKSLARRDGASSLFFHLCYYAMVFYFYLSLVFLREMAAHTRCNKITLNHTYYSMCYYYYVILRNNFQRNFFFLPRVIQRKLLA